MEMWKEYKIGEIGELRNGLNFESSQMGEGMPIINVKDVTDFQFIRQNKLDKVQINLKDNSDFIAKKGDLFFVRSSVKAEGAGEVSLLDEENISGIAHCGFIIRLRVDINKALPKYLIYHFRSNFFRNVITMVR